jgi:hypothetical protein
MAAPLTIYSPYSTFRTPVEPSAIRQFYQRLMSTDDIIRPGDLAENREGTIHTLVEAAATGGVLGAAHATLPNGLDLKVGPISAPVDGVLGALAVIASKAMGGKVGRSIHAIGDRAVGIWAFRSTAKLIAAKKGVTVSGDIEGDPLIDAAKNL